MDSLQPAHSKFSEPKVTATGSARASVELSSLETLWFNTGTLCNIECRHCYVHSSPTNDSLEYITADEVRRYLNEIVALGFPVSEIGFTGGEPFLNPEFLDMLEETLRRGFDVLVLTNAMRPMQRPQVREHLRRLAGIDIGQLVLRVSLDHYTASLHEAERGPGTWEGTLDGIRWLTKQGFRVSIAGRTRWNEPESATRAGYGALFASEGFDIATDNPSELVLFPELDELADVPEITTSCWAILGRSPLEMMCAQSRMVVKRRGASAPTVVPCTLLPEDSRFGSAAALADSLEPVYLDHPHCSKFCVLGGSSCSAR